MGVTEASSLRAYPPANQKGISLMRNYFGSAALVAIMLATAQGAYAADAAPAAPAADDSTSLDQVLITATKRETNLQSTPIAVSVLTATAMADRHAESLISLQDGAIPSLRVATFEARQSALTVGIRGIVPFDANQTARDQGVGVYIDGVYLGRQQGLNTALLDLERIEVLRGPQGTLFGRNTEGGALSIVTKAPTGVFGGRIVAGVGNYGAYTAELHQDFQEFNGLSIKVDGLLQHQDPTTKNPMAGQAGWNQYDRKGGRISALYAPTDKFSALVSVDYSKDENTPFFSQLLNYNPYGKRVRTLAEVQAGPAAAPGRHDQPARRPDEGPHRSSEGLGHRHRAAAQRRRDGRRHRHPEVQRLAEPAAALDHGRPRRGDQPVGQLGHRSP
jgi:iron complex outermembrane receptor protein